MGVTHRWYREPSLMFWAGAHDDRLPSLLPDEPAPGITHATVLQIDGGSYRMRSHRARLNQLREAL